LVDVGDLRLAGRVRQLEDRADRRAVRRARVDRARVKSLAEDLLDEEALLVGGVADLRPPLPAPRLQPLRRFRDRVLIGDLAAAFGPRLGDPLRRVEHLEAVAAFVADPAVVDVLVVAGDHPFHLLVADREADVALARAERADRARLL